MLSELRSHIEEKFGIRPCIFQAHSALAQLEQNLKDCITILPTGSRKTITFWIPLLFNKGGITVVVTLNILGDKNVAELVKLSISAVNITGKSATNELFKVAVNSRKAKKIGTHGN